MEGDPANGRLPQAILVLEIGLQMTPLYSTRSSSVRISWLVAEWSGR